MTSAPGSLYNWSKHDDGLKFQIVMAPNGICIDAFGPCFGFHHDAFLYNDSALKEEFRSIFESHGASVYADSAYPRQLGLFTSFKDPKKRLDRDQRHGQALLCSARGEVEHYFSMVVSNWRLFNNRADMKAGKRPIPALVFASFFLTNCLTCASGSNQSAARFNCLPPSLEEYLE